MNKFTREDIVSLLKLVIGIALIIIAIRFFINMLPFIIVALLIMLVYDSLKKKGNLPWQNKKEKDGIVEAEIIKEKKNN